MTTPPRVSGEEAAQAFARIVRRHRKAGNDQVLSFGDDAREMLSYLRKCGTAGLLHDDESHDLEDGLTLRLWLWWEGESLELWMLDAAERLGLNRRRIGARLGVTTGQGLVDRRDRKRAMFSILGRPDEKVIRQEKRDEQAARRAPAPPKDATTAFLDLVDRHRDELPDEVVENLDYLRTEVAPSSSTFRMFLADLIEDLQAAGAGGQLAAAATQVTALLTAPPPH